MIFRDLTENDIDVRVGQLGENWAMIMLYKDARVDMAILDETVGAERWQRKHYECKGNLFCSIGIKCDNGEWVWKDDVGANDNDNGTGIQTKGESSDSFKRAGTNWGIGRELYTIRNCIAHNVNTTKNKKGKLVLDGDLYVEKIKIENKIIVGLSIKQERNNKRVFVYSKETKPKEEIKKPKEELKKPDEVEI